MKFEAPIKYLVELTSISPIRQQKRPETNDVPSIGGRMPTEEEKLKLFKIHRYWTKKLGYYQTSLQVSKMLTLASHKAKVPGLGNTKFSSFVQSGVIIEPEKIPHLFQKKSNVRMVDHWTVNVSGGRRNQVRTVKCQINKWALRFNLTNLHPEVITEKYLRDFFRYAGMFCGLGVDRPNRGKVYGRFKVTKFEKVKK